MATLSLRAAVLYPETSPLGGANHIQTILSSAGRTPEQYLHRLQPRTSFLISGFEFGMLTTRSYCEKLTTKSGA